MSSVSPIDMVIGSPSQVNGPPLLFRAGVLGRLSAINVALLCFGFPVTSVVPLFLNMESYQFNLLLRAIYLGLSCYLIIGAYFHQWVFRLPIGAWLLILFWGVYSIRLFYDVHVEGLVFKKDLLKLYGFAFGNCFAGALATIFTLRLAPPAYLRKIILLAITLGCVGILAGVVFQYQTINPLEIVGRARFTIDNGTERGRDVLNPITISLTGQLLMVTATYLFFRDGINRRSALFTIPGIVCGALVLVMGGSRGPFLATMISVLLIIGINLYHFRKTTLNLLKVSTLLMLGVTAFVRFIVVSLNDSQLLVLQRLQSLGEGGEKEVRSYQWEAAIEQFLTSPIWGDRYLERYANFYPHNVYLEVLMATGLIGGAFFFGMLGYIFWKLFKDFQSNSPDLFYGLILFAILVSVTTSGSLFGSVMLWGGVALYLGLPRSVGSKRSS